MRRWFLVASIFAMTATAQDLDVDGARAAYNAAKRAADNAETEKDRAYARLKPFLDAQAAAEKEVADIEADIRSLRSQLSRKDSDINSIENNITSTKEDLRRLRRDLANARDNLRDARDEEGRLQNRLDQVQQRLRQARKRLRDLENKPRNGPWTCNYRDRGHEEHRGGHPATHKNRAKAQELAKAACLAKHGKCVPWGRCTQPPPRGLKEARRRVKELKERRDRVQRNLDSQSRTVQNLRRKVRDYQNRIADKASDLDKYQDQLSQANRDRDNIVSKINNEQGNLRFAQNKLTQANSDVARERPKYNSAYSAWKTAVRKAEDAYNYLQQVIANYNKARQAVIDLATSQGVLHGSKEATAKAGPIGTTDGARVGKVKGADSGKRDGSLAAEVKGYRAGRKEATSAGDLKNSYNNGLTSGKQLALKKAKEEKFPEGFNAAYAKTMQQTPLKSDKIDVTTSIPQAPGGSGHDLSGASMKVGFVKSPRFVMPTDPVLQPPTSTNPPVNVPPHGNVHYKPDCDGVALPEFKPLCLSTYKTAYQKGFEGTYKGTYLKKFASSFDVAAKKSYGKAVSGSFPSSTAKGRQSGAKDQGILDGFKNHLASAEATMFTAGEKNFSAKLAKGYLLKVHDAYLKETSGDGVLMPGEKATLIVIVDNLGLEMSPKEKLELKVDDKENLDGLSFEIRKLPALAPNTRTTLVGVVTATNKSKKAGEKFSLKATVKSGIKKLKTTHSELETHFPLELVSFTPSKVGSIGEVIDTKVVFKNMTNQDLKESEIELSSVTKIVEFPAGALKLAAVKKGESVSATTKIKPGMWVSNDTATVFESTKKDDQGKAEFTQTFSKVVKVTRDAIIKVTDSRGKPLKDSTITARAGGRFTILAQFTFLANAYRQGPFVMKHGRADKGISIASGGTTSVNYGSWQPGWTTQPIRFTYDVSRTLKGKTATIMLGLSQGGTWIHAPIIKVIVK